MAAYFTSDLHFGHGSIIKYCQRPFRDRDHMLKHMITIINQRVKPNDTLYHIGDFCAYGREKGVMGDKAPATYYEDLINAKVIHIMGNHDSNNKVKDGVEYAVMRMSNLNVLMVHKPECVYVDTLLATGAIDLVLCGHVHEKWAERVIDGILRINVGVDVRRFVPMSKMDVLKIYHKLKGGQNN